MTTLERRTPGLSLLAAAAALTMTLLAAYTACWLVAATPFAAPFAHAWLNLFSAEPQGSVAQLIEGLIFSAVASWFAVLIFVPIYNLVARADRVL